MVCGTVDMRPIAPTTTPDVTEVVKCVDKERSRAETLVSIVEMIRNTTFTSDHWHHYGV
jgi:hypothetical protein